MKIFNYDLKVICEMVAVNITILSDECFGQRL